MCVCVCVSRGRTLIVVTNNQTTVWLATKVSQEKLQPVTITRIWIIIGYADNERGAKGKQRSHKTLIGFI